MTVQQLSGIDWKNVKGVIFDVDGTLYDQRTLRLKMLRVLGGHLLAEGHAFHEVRVLRHFRKVREYLADKELSEVSEHQLVLVAGKMSIAPQEVANIVEKWIYTKPLKFIEACRFPMVDSFFEALRKRGIKIGIFSDYPIENKMAALGLHADAVCYSLEPDVNRFKPQTAGLQKLVKKMGLDGPECLFIGDRESRDGACARRFGMPFLLRRGRYFYKKLMQNAIWIE